MPNKNDFPKKKRPVRKNRNSNFSIEDAIAVIRNAGERWTSSIVPRNGIDQFTGGVYSPGYLANCDSQGIGPEGSFYIGRQKCYPVDSLVDWLISRLKISNEDIEQRPPEQEPKKTVRCKNNTVVEA